ncbi:hypothetical protein TKV_c01290 [Thermoanaerobacter kivui]|uniref:Uncharacterized protein n=1 Tax=Thermoanaerobacter kivui TaxID=2325 RepID=A0A097ANE2_THEKI|nr:hypothetical protein [Thermoanaerobacter kivui]AIS51334.1 hypothetical protein TKV_c01290 [Thermoanaerobacter kivui]
MEIVVRTKTYDDLKAWLKPDDKIILMSCNVCAKGCGVGGERILERLQKKLEKDGFNVIYSTLAGFTCNRDILEDLKTCPFTAKYFEEATVIIPIACHDGIENVEHVFTDKRVFHGYKSLGVGSVSVKEGIKLEIPFDASLIEKLGIGEDGIPIKDAAAKLGYYTGPF